MKLKKRPKDGEKRIVNKFSFLPTLLEDDTRIWLEKYQQEEVYNRESLFYNEGWYVLKRFQKTEDRCI